MSNESRLRITGKAAVLAALDGYAVEPPPIAVFTWTYFYSWRPAGLAPWQLAFGGLREWHRAHMALVERHRPDAIFFEGGGSGPESPELVGETQDRWVVRDGNTGRKHGLLKRSLAMVGQDAEAAPSNSPGPILTRDDADRRIAPFTGWGETYLGALRMLNDEVGDRALVLPHHSPGYIMGCYELGFERSMELMLTDPTLFLHVCDRCAEGEDIRMREWAKAGAEAVFIADSWASCDIISPSMFERFALPYQQRTVDAAHRAGLRVIFWNEGDILPILRQEADLGADAFAFEQPRKGADLTVRRVRGAFGPARCLFGNLDSEVLLTRGDPHEIAAAVERQVRDSGRGAPFVHCTGSPLPDDVAPEAVDAMIAAARAFRW